jgi:hypothetical protein
VSEDELGHVDLLLLVDLDGDALAIVVDAHPSLLGVHLHLQQVHPLVALVVVRSVDQDLIEDLVEGRHVSDLLEGELALAEDPASGAFELNAAHVGVRTEQDVLEGSLLLVGLLDGLLTRHLNYGLGAVKYTRRNQIYGGRGGGKNSWEMSRRRGIGGNVGDLREGKGRSVR